jgi:hypothetical protein
LEAGQGRRQAHGQTAQLLRPNARSGYDPTRPRNRRITREGALRCGAGANTAVCWRLDQKESTKLSLKYRRGKGEILIVSHAGRGWWDPTSDAKGDVFRLVQRLEPGLILALEMSASACERSPDCRHVFHRPIGQGAERSRTELSPPDGPSERRFGRTLLPGAISDDSAGCRRRSLRRRPRPAFCGRVPSAVPGSPISITPARSRTWMSEARLTKVR